MRMRQAEKELGVWIFGGLRHVSCCTLAQTSAIVASGPCFTWCCPVRLPVGSRKKSAAWPIAALRFWNAYITEGFPCLQHLGMRVIAINHALYDKITFRIVGSVEYC